LFFIGFLLLGDYEHMMECRQLISDKTGCSACRYTPAVDAMLINQHPSFGMTARGLV